ncbi:hypothetical protein ACFL2V_12725 [Pseudomonadota bacterium]
MTAETFITILSASGVILVTIYNIVSSKHYRAAKQAEIDSLKQQIDTLTQLTSPEVMRHFKATKKMLEDTILSLKDDNEGTVAQMRQKIEGLNQSIRQLLNVFAGIEFQKVGNSWVVQGQRRVGSTSPPPEDDKTE